MGEIMDIFRYIQSIWIGIIRSEYLFKVWASQTEFYTHSRVTSKCHGLNFTSYWQQFWGFSEVLFHFTVPVLFRHQRIAPTTVQNGKNAPSNAWLFSRRQAAQCTMQWISFTFLGFLQHWAWSVKLGWVKSHHLNGILTIHPWFIKIWNVLSSEKIRSGDTM